MTATTYQLGGGVTVTVADDGEGIPPWGNGDRAPVPVYRYQLTVATPAGEYRSPAWGSIRDRAESRRDHGGMGAVILADVMGAYADPEGTFRMIAEGWTGDRAVFPDRAAVVGVLDYLDTAAAIGADVEAVLAGTDGYADVPEDLDGCLRCGRGVLWDDGAGCYVAMSQALPPACGPTDTSASLAATIGDAGATLRGHNPYPRTIAP